MSYKSIAAHAAAITVDCFGWCVGLFMLSACNQGQPADSSAQASYEQLQRQKSLTSEQRRAEELLARQSEGLTWSYYKKTDEMGRGDIQFATLKSQNKFSLSFPYEGSQRAGLILRRHQKMGNDIMLTIERGQFLCDVDRCSIDARFDQGETTTLFGSTTENGDSTVIFLDNYNQILSNLEQAKLLKIEAKFFNQPPKVVEFDVSGLQWPK